MNESSLRKQFIINTTVIQNEMNNHVLFIDFN